MAQDLAQLFVADLGSSAVVRITGCANFASSVPFKKLVNGLIERGCAKFTLDLTDCKLMDSTFLGVLVGVAPRPSAPRDPPAQRVRVQLVRLGVLRQQWLWQQWLA